MSTSLFEGLVRSQESTWSDYDPVDAAWSRSIMSNVMHSADSCAQPLVNWRVADARAVSRTLTQASTYYVLWTSAALPIRLRGDGSSYRIRLRLRGARGTAGTVDFAVAVIGGRLTADAAYDAATVGAPLASTASTSSATHAWLTLSSATINLASAGVTTTEIERSTPAEIGGAATVVRYDAAKIVVLAKREAGSSSSTSAELTGIHACEYIGT